MFKAPDLQTGVTRRADGSVEFGRSANGMLDVGAYKEIAWSPTPLKGAVAVSIGKDLEDACASDPCFVARQIAPNWYLTYIYFG